MNMQHTLKTISISALTCIIIMIGMAAVPDSFYQDIRLSPPLSGKGTSVSPLHIDTSGSSPIPTKFGLGHGDIEVPWQNWWNHNLIGTIDPTHNARKHVSTVNNLGGWIMNAGVLDPMTFAHDSLGVVITGPGQVEMNGDGGFFVHGAGLNPLLRMYSNKIELVEDGGNIYIDTLTRYDAMADVVGISSSTGHLYITKRIPDQLITKTTIDSTNSSVTLNSSSVNGITMIATGAKTATLPNATWALVGLWFRITNASTSGDITVSVAGGSGDTATGSLTIHPNESATWECASATLWSHH